MRIAQKVWLKERTADSIPFMSAEEKCHLSQLGYAEDEYFFSGTANVYDEKEDKIPYVICKDAPYTSRMMIRRPKDPAKFSSDIYIGLTSKSDVLPALYMYDGERYKDINWSNPMPQRPAPENMEGFRFGFDPRFEYGLFWDMLADVGKLLKNQIPGNPIKDYGDYKVYLTGWSQSTWYLMRWLKSFAYLPENYDQEPLYDGYVSAGGTDHQAPLKANKGIF